MGRTTRSARNVQDAKGDQGLGAGWGDALRAGRPIAVLGSMNADYTVEAERIPLPGETVVGGPMRVLPGGKSANQAAAAARIGARVSMLGAVGDDSNGILLLDGLRDAGVDVSGVTHVPEPSGTTLITVDPHGENTIVYSSGANGEVDAPYVRSVGGTLSSSAVAGLCLEAPMEAVRAAAAMAHEAGALVVLNDSPFRSDLPDDLVAATDVLLVNEHEMALLLGVPEPEDGDWRRADWVHIASLMNDHGFARSIVTLGSEGACVLDSQSPEGLRSVWVDAVAVQAVDTTGCGDAFMGAVIAGLASGMELVESAHIATYVAAYAALGRGAQSSYGTMGKVRERLAV